MLSSTRDNIVAVILMTISSGRTDTSNVFNPSSELIVKSSATVCGPGVKEGMGNRLDGVGASVAPRRWRFAESRPSTGSGGPRFLVASSNISVRDRMRRSTCW